MGYCDARTGEPKLAIQAMHAAIAQPRQLALPLRARGHQGAGGRGPRPTAGARERLNPLAQLTIVLERIQSSDPEVKRRAAAARAEKPFG